MTESLALTRCCQLSAYAVKFMSHELLTSACACYDRSVNVEGSNVVYD